MGTVTKYTCDLCNAEYPPDQMTYVMLSNRSRAMIDGHVDVGPCCVDRPVSEVLAKIAPQPEPVGL